MILQGVINKFGALFIIIPQPVVGGIFCVMFGMITAFGKTILLFAVNIFFLLIYFIDFLFILKLECRFNS